MVNDKRLHNVHIDYCKPRKRGGIGGRHTAHAPERILGSPVGGYTSVHVQPQKPEKLREIVSVSKRTTLPLVPSALLAVRVDVESDVLGRGFGRVGAPQVLLIWGKQLVQIRFTNNMRDMDLIRKRKAERWRAVDQLTLDSIEVPALFWSEAPPHDVAVPLTVLAKAAHYVVGLANVEQPVGELEQVNAAAAA